MESEPEASPPLMWYTEWDYASNLLVVTDNILYIAWVKSADLRDIDLGLEDGQPPERLLPAKKTRRIPLEDLESFQVKHYRIELHAKMNKDVTIHFRDGKKKRKVTIEFPRQEMRDDFVLKLNERVGPWPIHEADESPWMILANYLWIIFVIAMLTFGACYLLLSGVITEAPVAIAWYLNLCGVWGLLIPGMLICVVVLINGIRQLRTPPVIVTYAK